MLHAILLQNPALQGWDCKHRQPLLLLENMISLQICFQRTNDCILLVTQTVWSNKAADNKNNILSSLGPGQTDMVWEHQVTLLVNSQCFPTFSRNSCQTWQKNSQDDRPFWSSRVLHSFEPPSSKALQHLEISANLLQWCQSCPHHGVWSLREHLTKFGGRTLKDIVAAHWFISPDVLWIGTWTTNGMICAKQLFDDH